MFAAVGKGGLKRGPPHRHSRRIVLAVAAVMAHDRARDRATQPRDALRARLTPAKVAQYPPRAW
jgi:hypothetical protein